MPTSSTDPAPTPERERRLPPFGTILRNVGLVAVLLVMLWLVWNVHLPDMDVLRDDITDLGPWAYLGFAGLYALVAITPIPVTVMALAGGMAFGLVPGTIMSMLGVVAGCMIAFWLARLLGRDTVMKLLGSHAATIEDRLGSGGFLAVCTLRLMPGIPYWPVNYGAGALGVPTREFLLATIISSIPGQLSLVALGAYIANPGIPNLVALVLCWILVIGLTLFSLAKWRGVRKAGADGSDGELAAEGAEA